MQYRFHRFAEAELEESVLWYLKRSENAKNNFIREVLDVSQFVCDNPTVFPVISGVKRSASLKNFPFSIIYVVDETGVFILSVFHHDRNPNIWKSR